MFQKTENWFIICKQLDSAQRSFHNNFKIFHRDKIIRLESLEIIYHKNTGNILNDNVQTNVKK